MIEFLKRMRKENLIKGNMDLEVVAMSSPETITNLEVGEEPIKVQDIEQPKFIIKEDAKIMSIPCDHKNVLPQALLKIDKKLITNPDNVAIFVNLSHLDSVDTIEEGYKEVINIKDPCGGDGYIQGEVYLEKVILIGGVHYSILIFDSVTMNKVYDGEVEFLTAYTNIGVYPFGEEVEVDPAKVTAEFTTVLTKLDDIPGVDYHLYTVDGEVELKVLP